MLEFSKVSHGHRGITRHTISNLLPRVLLTGVVGWEEQRGNGCHPRCPSLTMVHPMKVANVPLHSAADKTKSQCLWCEPLRDSCIPRRSYLAPLFETRECLAQPGTGLSSITQTTQITLHCLERLLPGCLRQHLLEVREKGPSRAGVRFHTWSPFSQRKGILLAKHLTVSHLHSLPLEWK